MKNFDIILRTIIAIYLIASYMIAVGLTEMYAVSFYRSLLATTGLIMFIVGAVALLVMHKEDSRSLYELLIIVAIPILTYMLIFSTTSLTTKSFWIFLGSFNFVTIMGGFLLGIIFSPIIYGMTKSSSIAKEMVKIGVSFVKNLGLWAFGIIVLAGAALAVIHFLNKIIKNTSDLTIAKNLALYGLILVQTFIVAKTTYLHTIFNIFKKH